MGYILILTIGGLAVVAILVAVTSGRRRGPMPKGADVTQKKPAADQPTPGASATAPASEVKAAQKRIPPA